MEKWAADAGANGRAAPEPAAHYKFASFARFRCARQKMSQSFPARLSLTPPFLPQAFSSSLSLSLFLYLLFSVSFLCFVSLFMLLGLNVSFCLGAHAKKYAETMSSIICIQFLPCHFLPIFFPAIPRVLLVLVVIMFVGHVRHAQTLTHAVNFN